MYSINFSPDVRELLRKGGWSEDRNVDITDWLANLERKGYECPPQAKAIMANMNGIHLDSSSGPFDFGSDRSLSWITNTDQTYLSKIIGEPLCPIGHGCGFFLLVSISGKFILLSDEWLFYFQYDQFNRTLSDLFFTFNESPPIWLTDDQRPPGYKDSDDGGI